MYSMFFGALLLSMIIRVASLLALSTLLFGGMNRTVSAQPVSQLEQDIATFQFNPPDSGLPDNTTGGASRDSNLCRRQQTATQASNITLLAPSSFVGLTVSEHPIFLLHADQTLAKQLFINLQDEQGEVLYQGFQDLPVGTGLFRVELPEDTPYLEVEQTYRLSVVAVCESALRPEDPVMTAYVEKISLPELAASSSQSSSFTEAVAYANFGVWYDTLEILEKSLRTEPENEVFTAAWESLLVSGGLTNLGIDVEPL